MCVQMKKEMTLTQTGVGNDYTLHRRHWGFSCLIKSFFKYMMFHFQ